MKRPEEEHRYDYPASAFVAIAGVIITIIVVSLWAVGKLGPMP